MGINWSKNKVSILNCKIDDYYLQTFKINNVFRFEIYKDKNEAKPTLRADQLLKFILTNCPAFCRRITQIGLIDIMSDDYQTILHFRHNHSNSEIEFSISDLKRPGWPFAIFYCSIPYKNM